MTNPIHAVTEESGRYYVHPTSGEKMWSVSTISKALSKPFLMPWAAKLCAEYAIEDWEYLSTLKGPDRIQRIKTAHTRVTNRAAAKGSQVHAIIEDWLRKGGPGDYDISSAPKVPDLEKWNAAKEKVITKKELQPYFDGFRQWCDDFQPEILHSETTVWSRKEKYAGTLDLLVKLADFGVCIMDAKSGNAIYPEVGLQLAAYARAEFYLGHDGQETPLPQAEAAFGLHVTPGVTKMLPVRIEDEVYRAFLYIREAFRFQEVISKTILGSEVKP